MGLNVLNSKILQQMQKFENITTEIKILQSLIILFNLK